MLTEKQINIGRRNFIKMVSALPAIGLFDYSALDMEPVKVALIGAGGIGLDHIKKFDPKYIQVKAVCDIRPGAQDKALHLLKKEHDMQADAYADYKDALKRDDIEAVIIGTPLWTHAPIAIDALNAGKHVFCEKMMAKTVEQCQAMIDAADSNKRILQIGYQRFYSKLYQDAYQLIRNGLLGDIYYIRTSWHLSGGRKRTIEGRDKRDMEKGLLSPTKYGYQDLEHLINWRMYWKYSEGYAAELLSHQTAVTNWVYDAEPTSVMGMGGTYIYKNDREIEDHFYCTFGYPNGRTVTSSMILSNDFEPTGEVIMGTEGILYLIGSYQAYLFLRQGKSNWKYAEIDTIAKDLSNKLDVNNLPDKKVEPVNYGSDDSYKTEFRGFANAIRKDGPVLSGGREGMAAAKAIIAANRSIKSRQAVEI